MTNRVLFLDIDGVFIPSRMYMAPNQTKPIVTTFDPGVVGMVNTLAKDCGFKFVIHSSWLRTSLQFIGQGDMGEEMTTHIHMINQGLKREYFHKDHSCTYRFSGTRWLAISEWLDRHREVTNYRILEDEPCYYYDYPEFEGKVVQTYFDEGLTFAQFKRIKDEFTDK